ncbi:MAG: extracellular solute-binding protein [Candidatus Kapaibacterium sp.]
MFLKIIAVLLTGIFLASCNGRPNQEDIVNVYSHRTFSVDNELMKKFTDETGIMVNIINSNDNDLLERLENEAANTPCDLFITMDAGTMELAKEKELIIPIESDFLESVVPVWLRDEDNYWFAIAKNLRIIAYSKERANPSDLMNYYDLTSERWRGKILVSPGGRTQNKSLLSVMAARDSIEAYNFSQRLAANFARKPSENDRMQIRALYENQGDICLVNHNYIGKMLKSENEKDSLSAASVDVIFPDLMGHGVHMNLSCAGISKYSDRVKNALKLFEFLLREDNQTLIAKGSYEFPVNSNASLPEYLQEAMEIKIDTAGINLIGPNLHKADSILKMTGW